jgi:hypothetical protein
VRVCVGGGGGSANIWDILGNAGRLIYELNPSHGG